MPSSALTSAAPVARLVVSLLLVAAAPAAAGDLERVSVVNFPETQKIKGSVRVDGPTVQTRLAQVSQEVVPPVARSETTALIAGGVLNSAGFGSVVLSLAGQVRADRFLAGTIGAVLVPDTELVRRAFEEDGQMLFALEAQAPAAPSEAAYFSSEQPSYELGFPRYRVYFYNTTDRPASVTLYAYLVN